MLELRGAQGVLMPSVDRVGRYFPLTLLRWLADGDAPCRRWWTLAGQAGLGGLHGDLDASDFDQLLQRRFSAADAAADGAAEPMLELPPAGHSLWGIFDDGGVPTSSLSTGGVDRSLDGCKPGWLPLVRADLQQVWGSLQRHRQTLWATEAVSRVL